MLVVAGMVKGLGVVGVLAALGTVVVAADARLRDEAPKVDAAAELVYLPDAKLVRPLALGFDNAFADVLWFRTINYFGQHYAKDREYPWLARMCDLVTDLDPRAEHVYRFAGLILPWEAKEEDEGIRLLEKGVRNRPDSWLLPYFLGIVRYFFKDDYGGAAEDLRRAASLPGAAPSVAHMAAILHAREHGSETTLEFLREMERETDDPRLKSVIARSLREAQVGADVQRLDGLIATYRERAGKSPTSLDDLVTAGLLPEVPRDPYGGRYRLDSAGEIRSSRGKRARELRDSPIKQRRQRSSETTS